MLRARSDSGTRWVLASDASCETCRQISKAVAAAVEGKLEILPLTDPEVQRWRKQWFGTDPAWKPVLFRIQGEQVRGWAGQMMVTPLVFHLGLRSTVRVVAALGRLKQEVKQARTVAPRSAALDRKQFLRFGAGIAVAAGLVLTGRNPAFAEKAAASAQAWVEANRARLPQTYDAVVEYSMPYRREIFRALPPDVRSRLWVTQLDRISAGHGNLSAEQVAVVARVRALAAQEGTFVVADEGAGAVRSELAELRMLAEEAFGSEASALFGSLGPEPVEVEGIGVLATCNCNRAQDFSRCGCRCIGCSRTSLGCGFLWLAPCDGSCCA